MMLSWTSVRNIRKVLNGQEESNSVYVRPATLDYLVRIVRLVMYVATAVEDVENSNVWPANATATLLRVTWTTWRRVAVHVCITRSVPSVKAAPWDTTGMLVLAVPARNADVRSNPHQVITSVRLASLQDQTVMCAISVRLATKVIIAKGKRFFCLVFQSFLGVV